MPPANMKAVQKTNIHTRTNLQPAICGTSYLKLP
uniref:Uncharacterized protein n=1 Tax=Arundo donax TaxID=35708 RepID=A0A0A9HSG8_ARUDO